jgi:hypothetical protein
MKMDDAVLGGWRRLVQECLERWLMPNIDPVGRRGIHVADI